MSILRQCIFLVLVLQLHFIFVPEINNKTYKVKYEMVFMSYEVVFVIHSQRIYLL
jgi:hypothetical protein